MKKKKEPHSVGIMIAVEKKTLKRLHRMIQMVLRADVENSTKQEALRVIPQVASIHNVNVSNCSVSMGDN